MSMLLERKKRDEDRMVAEEDKCAEESREEEEEEEEVVLKILDFFSLELRPSRSRSKSIDNPFCGLEQLEITLDLMSENSEKS